MEAGCHRINRATGTTNRNVIKNDSSTVVHKYTADMKLNSMKMHIHNDIYEGVEILRSQTGVD